MPQDFDNTRALNAYGLTAQIENGALRRISLAGREVIRLIDYPIRDADWGTVPLLGVSVEHSEKRYRHCFTTEDASIEGRFEVQFKPEGSGARIVATLLLKTRHDTIVNRAGFVLLHPLTGVVDTPVQVRCPQGSTRKMHFPALISPGQPVDNIAGLEHKVGEVSIDIAFDGDVFEMEDQRNWTDASFKTYCRPLALPRPYTLQKGTEIRQQISIILQSKPQTDARPIPAHSCRIGRMPAIEIAYEPGLTGPFRAPLDRLGAQGIQIRLVGQMDYLRGLPDIPVTLEIVCGQDAEGDLARIAETCRASGIDPSAVIALPEPYLKSHQPQGPWPMGPAPMDLVGAVRRYFPQARVGGGMLTNFTEFNRCPPDPALVDYVTFGTTAIVHAADDNSVIETLEALPDVIASAAALAHARPMRLGLMSIAMRSNPYGAKTASNPDGELCLPMAMNDPRQRTGFAAAFAIGVAAASAAGGVASFAPAMASGPLGMDRDGRPLPLWHIVAALAALSGAEVEISHSAAGLVVIRGDGRRGIMGVVANIGTEPAGFDTPACLVPENADWDWIDLCAPLAHVILPPRSAAILKGRPS